MIESVMMKGGMVLQWPEKCATEERIFLDVPWNVVIDLVHLAEEYVGYDSVKETINNAARPRSLPEIADLTLPPSLDSPAFRRAIGTARRTRAIPGSRALQGGAVAETISSCLDQMSGHRWPR